MIESFFLRKLLVRTGLARLLPCVRRELAGGEDFLHYYSDRTLAVPLDQLADPALLPNVHTPDSINLALGVPPCELPAQTSRVLAGQPSVPAWGDIDLRTELGTQLHLDHGVEYDPVDEVLITHGAIIDPTVDRYDVLHLVRGDTLVDIVPVEARGASQ